MNSLVFRGIPDKRVFEEAVAAARKWHDGEIILSTWEGAEEAIDASIVDKLILTRDPGPLKEYRNPSLIHATRQIVAAHHGVREATGTNTLLLRTDCIPHSSLFKFIEERSAGDCHLFKNKMVCGNIMTIHPDYRGFPPHEIIWRVGDWFQCGTTEDVYRFTDIVDEFEKHKNTGYGLEQIWVYSCFTKFKPECVSGKNWWEHLVGNFKIIDNESTGDLINARYV